MMREVLLGKKRQTDGMENVQRKINEMERERKKDGEREEDGERDVCFLKIDVLLLVFVTIFAF